MMNTFPGMTEEGLELLQESRSHTDLQLSKPSDAFRLITIWQPGPEERFSYRAAIVTLGDVWKLIEATLEPVTRFGDTQQSCLWITAAKLTEEDLGGPCHWATPSSLPSSEGAVFWRWQRHPSILWQKPGYSVPAPAEVAERTIAQCQATFLQLTLPLEMRPPM